MRFLLDEDVHPAAAEAAQALGLDAVSVHDLGRRDSVIGSSSNTPLPKTDLMVTRNRDDFIRLTVASYQAGEQHPGVIIIRYSLPNKRAYITRSRKKWQEQQQEAETRYGIFFLEA